MNDENETPLWITNNNDLLRACRLWQDWYELKETLGPIDSVELARHVECFLRLTINRGLKPHDQS